MTGNLGLSLFVQVRSGQPPQRVYRRNIELARDVEALGFGTVWFAARHFGAHHAALPALFPFLGAVSQATERIRLGTGVVALPFEDPLRLVEDAAVVDHLTGGRLELGLGKGLGHGFSASSFAAFDLPESERETLYDSRIERVHQLLASGTAGPGIDLHPKPGSLRARVWQSTGNIETARRAGAAGDGLLPHGNSAARAGRGVAELVDAYRDAYRGPGAPRVGSAFTVLPGDDRADALDLLRRDVEISPDYYRGKLDDGDHSRFLADAGAHIGSTDDLVAAIAAQPELASSTEILFHVPLDAEHPRLLDCLRRVADEVFPRLTTVLTVA